MSTQLVVYKFKLKPTKSQSIRFDQWLGTCRLIYNLALEAKIDAYKKSHVNLSRYDLQKQLKDLSEDYSFIKDVHSQVRQSPLVRLEKTYNNFFRGAGFPKFAKKNGYKSFEFPQGVKIDNKHITLPKFGKVKFFLGKRDVDNFVVKNAKITKEHKGWFVSILVEQEISHLPKNSNSIGVDLGVAHYAVTSEGEVFENPKHLNKYKRKLKIAQRKVSRSKKGSNRRKKAVHELQKIYLKIKNTRTDFLQKLSTKLINENQVIVVENLKFSNMTKSAKGTLENPGTNVKQKSGLNKAILDLAGSSFFSMLEYKAKWYGREFHKVDPKYTSQTCSSCGHKAKENRKTQSSFECVSCGNKMNADHNAAINILGRACPSGVINGVACEPENLHLYV